MTEESKFCTGCGKNLEPGMQFCPQCGKVVAGSDAEAAFKQEMGDAAKAWNSINRTWLMFFLLVYAIPVVVGGLYVLFDSSSLADSVWASAEFQKWIENHDLNYTIDDVRGYIEMAAALMTLSGVFAFVSCGCIYKKRKWLVAVICCSIAAVLCFWSVFGMIVGFLVAWIIVGSKQLFDDRSD